MKRRLVILGIGFAIGVGLALASVQAQTGEGKPSCVNVCPTPAPSPTPVCLRTLPPDVRWEIRLEYRDGGEGKPYLHPAGQFGTIDEVNCYLNNHTSQKGVYVVLPAEDTRCAPGLDVCLWMVPPGEILNAYGVRVQ